MKKPQEVDLSSAVMEWTQYGFTMSSGYYAGRPPSPGDLSSRMLEQIYQGIKRDVGEEEATNFVLFVDRLRDMSASAFIAAFERFWANGCNPDVQQEKSDRTRLDARGPALEVQALCTIFSSMYGQLSEEEIERRSALMKFEFISRRRRDLPDIKDLLSKEPISGLHYAPR